MIEEPKPHATSNGTSIGYKVEARIPPSAGARPEQVGGQLFGSEWRTIEFQEGSGVGVPGESPLFSPFQQHYSLKTFAQAQALRWWFLANMGPMSFKLETRLRRYKVEYTSKCFQQDAEEYLAEARSKFQ